MLHMRRKQDLFNFLASTLASLEEEFSNVLAIRSDRDASLTQERHFSHYSQVVILRKTGDVTRRGDDLRVGDLDKEFLLDIFGSDARKETGLIDASSSQEFDARVESLTRQTTHDPFTPCG